MSTTSQIQWPSGFETANCKVHVHNELAMTSVPETVWAWLIRAQLWPTWYPNSANIEFLTGQPPNLALGTRFRWKTFGITIESNVLEFVPNERLAWDAHGTGLNVYHAWLIQKTNEGCKVITEENQGGVVAQLGKTLRPTRMEKMHQIWLEGLSARASTGLPPEL
jgi:hypothetical protein